MKFSNRQYWYIGIGILVIYIVNLFLDVMDVDAAQYASIALEMSKNNSFLEVFHRGNDYLDKPPFIFWLSAMSFKIFGVSNWAYKLSALIILLTGIYATYKFARLYYSKQISIFSSFIVACSQVLFLVTNDIRMDGVFMGLLILSFWKVGAYFKYKKKIDFVIGGFFIACALMTKGPLALIIFASGFGLHFILNKQWKEIFHIRWTVFLLIIVIVIFPMCYGLYSQFDLQPEKQVYGLDGPSGLKFFFWTQSFGRITGDIYWENGLPFHFFTTSILWDYQPWISLFYPALFLRIKNSIQKKQAKEYITLGSFVFPFIALSLSNYKLPHYVFPLFPFVAIITSSFIVDVLNNLSWKKYLYYIQYFFIILFLIAPLIAFVFFFTPHFIHILVFLIFWGVAIFIWKKNI